jgi:hypothetical protein
MPGWKEDCQNQVLTGRHRPSITNPTGGKTFSRVVSDSNRRMIYEFAMVRRSIIGKVIDKCIQSGFRVNVDFVGGVTELVFETTARFVLCIEIE